MLWGTPVGYVSMGLRERFARFEYDPAFAGYGIELAPLHMPAVPDRIYRFDDLQPRSFHGLPGLLADSLPDRYGHRLIDVWLASKGKSAAEFNAVDRLCYVGQRGMGALDYVPATRDAQTADKLLEVNALVELAAMAFASKQALDTKLSTAAGDDALLDILSVGTSAGGARAKAVIAFNPLTREVRSGQLDLAPGFQHWLIKFDGVQFSGDWVVADPAGYGLLEYAYARIAGRCEIEMTECRLLSEHGRNHFMTRRFDRELDGGKRFVQSFAAIAHFDYWESGKYSYEQLFMTMKQLGLPQAAVDEQFRRVVFNLVGCNQDDHVKNFSFFMDRQGEWSLTPAYDLCHAEGSDFTRSHQLSINGKLTGFDRADLKHLASYAGLPRGRDRQVLERTLEAFSAWPVLADEVGVPRKLREHVGRTLRLAW
jgi:serine/threonine-protein kinase HipA